MYQQLWGYKVEEKLYLGVREQKRLNTTALYKQLCFIILYPLGRHPAMVQIQYVYLISRHHCSFYYHYMFRSLLDHLQSPVTLNLLLDETDSIFSVT
jgi:hypothetical protein